MNRLTAMYVEVSGEFSQLPSPSLLAVRLYWGWQFVQTGWSKMHNIAKITKFISTLNIPFSASNGHFMPGLEFLRRVLLILASGRRLVGLPMAATKFMAYWTADLERLGYVFSDLGKFYVTDFFTFLFASLIVLVFGAGFLSTDRIINQRVKEQA